VGSHTSVLLPRYGCLFIHSLLLPYVLCLSSFTNDKTVSYETYISKLEAKITFLFTDPCFTFRVSFYLSYILGLAPVVAIFLKGSVPEFQSSL
jgi:hypothetical protein